MIGVNNLGDFKKTTDFIVRMLKGNLFLQLDRYGQMGMIALANATPVNSGLTADSWSYKVTRSEKRPAISWHNRNMVDGTPVVILIQYGHATGTGGYVAGRDFINPAIQPIFDEIANEIWKEVTS